MGRRQRPAVSIDVHDNHLIGDAAGLDRISTAIVTSNTCADHLCARRRWRQLCRVVQQQLYDRYRRCCRCIISSRPCWQAIPPNGNAPSWCRSRCLPTCSTILTDPEDGEALRIDDISSVNLSEPIGGGDVPIGDPRRRSYIATERGNQSLEHLIALARAHLMKRARVVEIAFAPKLARMPEITLRKNAFLIEPRVGEALGKIIGYSLALDGSDGRINCEVRIGCTIGRGGSAVAAGGNADLLQHRLYRRRLSAVHRPHRAVRYLGRLSAAECRSERRRHRFPVGR